MNPFIPIWISVLVIGVLIYFLTKNDDDESFNLYNYLKEHGYPRSSKSIYPINGDRMKKGRYLRPESNSRDGWGSRVWNNRYKVDE